MQAQESLFQKISIPATLLFLFLSLNRCTADSVWGVPQERFRRQLLAGEREFLSELNVEERDLAEAFRLGPGAPFYLSRIFISMGLEQTAEQLLSLQWRRGDTPWREEAGLQLLERFLEAERYGEAEEQAGDMLGRLPDRAFEQRVQRLLLEALYWQEKDEEVLAALAERRDEGAPWDGELDLFAAVSSQRLGRAGWQALFVELFFNGASSSLHARAYAYLEQEELLAAFPPAVSSFFEGRSLLYQGRNEGAIERVEGSLEALGVQGPEMEILFREMGAAYLAEARYAEGAERLMLLAAPQSPAARLAAVEMAGRLFRKGGQLEEAERLLSRVFRETESPEQRDRAIWFVLDIAAGGSAARLIEKIEELAPLWSEPRYFADLIEAEISRLVAGRDWEALASLHRALAGYCPPDTMARLSYVVGRALSLGLLPASATPLSPQALFLGARSAGRRYYAFLAEAALIDMGFPAQWALVQGGPANGSELEQAGEQPQERSSEAVIRGYFDFGLYREGAELLRSRWRTVSAGLLLDSAVILNSHGQYFHSMRLMNLYAAGRREAVEISELELLYPRAYAEWIEEFSNSEELPVTVFYALVREESYFDPQIVSRSGAVGLTQLMEETAADTARWMRIEQYDLRDPEQNLRIGAHHFARLFVRLEDVPKTLMAYNAGLARLRGWERTFAGLPTDLLAEAVPYPETRNYVRKILVSAVYYGALYYDRSLEQTVRLFFPGGEQ